MADIQLANVSKSYGAVPVIENVSLDIRSGELVIFLGPSGSGKSTLLRMIAGLETIDTGTLTIGGTRCESLPPGQRGVAMVFQNYALYPHMTVGENMAFGLRNVGMGPGEIATRIAEAVRVLEIGPLLERRPAQLSGGQRQRVAIGRAIVKEPRAFLFDEPLSNLDAALRVRTRVELAELHQRLKSTMIYVTHDQTEAMTLADRIVVLNDRRIEQIGTPLEVYSRPASRFVAAFVGSPAMNFLDVTVESRGVERRALLAFGTSLPLQMTIPGDGRYQLGVRPENLRVLSGGGDLQGEATVVERLGDRTLVHLRLPDGAMVTAQDTGRSAVVPGTQVGLEIDRSEVHLFDEKGRAWHPEAMMASAGRA